MAPEQRASGNVDGRADLYACGVVLYELLTGERPAGTDVPSDLKASTPKYLDDVFRHSYARLEKRFKSAEEFMEELGGGKTALPLESGPLVQISHAAVGMQRCPSCRKDVDALDQFCMHCGVQLVATVRRCSKCGAFPDGTDHYCIFCGETLSPPSNQLTPA
jgi:serine/threonine protein kinase